MKTPHPLKGRIVQLKCELGPDKLNGRHFEIEDWWENVAGRSWMVCKGNPACLEYAIRSAHAGLPIDNNVVYGKVGCLGFLIHESELGPEVTQERTADRHG